MRILHLLGVFVFVASASIACGQIASAPGPQLPAVARAQASTGLLDINTATAQQLKSLPGFGDAYVRRVIAGRPYKAKNQLVTRGVLPASAYARVASRIVAHRLAK